jgi:hypothetical protein
MRAAYDKPVELLKFHEDEGVQIEAQASPAIRVTNGVWRVSVTAVENSRTFFSDNDFVRLRFEMTAPTLRNQPGLPLKNRTNAFVVGPFPLEDFTARTFELPAFDGSHLEVTMLSAHLRPDRDDDGERHFHVLGRTTIYFPTDRELGCRKSFEGVLRMTQLIGQRVPECGVKIAGEMELINDDLELGQIIPLIIAQAHPATHSIILNEPPTSCLRLTLPAAPRAKGEFWGMSVTNQAREAAGIPHCAGIRLGLLTGVSDGAEFIDAPLPRFLRAFQLCRLLPRVPERHLKFPNLRLSVIEEVVQSRWYSSSTIKRIRTELTLDGRRIQPWYNFSTWDVAYDKKEYPREGEFGEHEDVTSLKAQMEELLKHEVGLWVDLPHRLMVVYGNEVTAGRWSIRGMHVTIPMEDHHVALLADLPPPTILDFLSESFI